MAQDMNLVRSWARRYYDLGFNPLPSRGDAKRPALRRFREYLHGKRIPSSWLTSWWAPNIQIPLGVAWGHCVVDIDGSWASREYNFWQKSNDSTWISSCPVISGSHKEFTASYHVWYRLPDDIEKFPTVHLWRSESQHAGISILGDGAMAMAPPSIHPERCVRYLWLCGPEQMSQPAVLPHWLRDRICEAISSRSSVRTLRERPRPLGLKIPEFRGHYQREEVLSQLSGRMHVIARNYGLEVHRHANGSGFHSCRSIDREDSNWSCTIDPRTGVYHDFATGDTLSFFTLLMRLDAQEFPDFPTTVDKMGAIAFGGKPCLSPRR
jgi:hypothetical protein